MHGPIRDRLEDLLRKDEGLGGHLASCAECSSEIHGMRQINRQLATLRGPEVEPAAGFYMRVLQRIEEHEGPITLLAFLAESAFSRRLVLASLTLAVALGGYVVSQERHQGYAPSTEVAVSVSHLDPPVMGSQDEQRDAVLANFAVHQLNASQRSIQ